MSMTGSSTVKTWVLLAVFGLAAASASAADLYWSGNATVIGGSGTWNSGNTTWNLVGPQLSGNVNNVTGNWTSASSDNAIFGMTNNATTVTLSSAITVGGIATTALSGNGTGGLSITANATGGSALTISSGAILNVASANHTLTLNNSNGNSIASGNFTKTGAGTLIFASAFGMVSNTGTITLSDGILRLNGNNINFANQTLSLTSSTAVLETNSNSISSGLVGSNFASLTGNTGTIRTSNTGSIGYLRLINSTDIAFGGTLTDGLTTGVLGFTKTGTGKVSLSNSANNNTGFVGIWGGIWEATEAEAGSGKITLAGYGRGTGRTAGTYQNTGNGTLDAAATVAAFYSGTIKGYNLSLDDLNNRVQVLSGGLLRYDVAGDIAGTGQVLGGASPGAILGFGFDLDNSTLQRVKTGFNGTIALTANGTQNLDFSSTSGLNSANARLGAIGTTANVTYSGTITPNGSIYMLGGGTNKLILTNALVDSGGARNLNVGAETLLGQMTCQQQDAVNFVQLANTGTASIDTTQVAHPILTASNTLSGTTTVGPYSVLELSGSNGALSATASVTLRGGGALYLNDRTGATKGDRINNSANLTVNQGGVVNYRGTGNNTETMNVLNLNSGDTYVVTARDSGTGNATLQFASLNRSDGATMRNNLGGGTLINFMTGPTPGGDNNALGGWATASSGADWASYNSSTIGTMNTYLTSTGNANLPNTWMSGNNVLLSANITYMVDAAHTTIFSLKATGGVATTLDLNGQTFTIGGGGIISNINQQSLPLTQNGTLTAGNSGGSNYELVFWSSGSGRNITVAANTTIADNAGNPVKVVRSVGGFSADGTATLNLTGNNTYSGGTYINNGGTVAASLANSLGSGPVYLNGVYDSSLDIAQAALSTLTLGGATGNRTLANDIYVNGDGYLSQIAGNWTTTGNLALNNGSTLRVGGSVTMNGTTTGTGGLSFWNTGTTTIGGSGNNTYSGDTLNLGGTVVLAKSGGNAIGGNLYIGGFSQNSGTPAERIVLLAGSDQIADSSVVTLIGAGTVGNSRNILRMNGNSDTIGGLVSTLGNGIVENNHASAASNLTINVGAGKSFSFGGLLRNGAAGKLNLIKSGSGVQTLTGVNTYNGTTTISAGTLQFAQQVSLYSGNTAYWTSANLTVASGAILAVNVGGTGEFTSANVDTLKGLGTGSGGFTSGAILGLDTTNATGGTFTYNSSIANPNGGANVLNVTKLGTGILALGGANAYTGTTTVSTGTLQVANAAAIPSGSGAGNVLVTGALDLNGNSITVNGLTGTGIVNSGVVGAVTLTVGANDQTSNFGGNITNGSGTMSLTKTGAGVQTLSATNTYTGSTIITNGKLVISNTGLINSTSGITVNVGGALEYQNITTALNKAITNAGGTVIIGPGATVRVAALTGLAGYQSTAAAGLHTQFLLLDGTAGDSGSGGRDLTVGWQTTTGSEATLVSDVLSFSGTEDDLYALQLSYDPSAVGTPFLAYYDGSSFVNAGTIFVGNQPYNSTSDFKLGNYGVDTINHVAWAVVKHNSEWAVTVVPEPGTMALLAFGSLAVLNVRRKKKTA